MKYVPFSLLAFLLFALMQGGTAQAQNPVSQPLAAVVEGELTLIDGTNRLAISNPPNRGLSNVVWSPDGSRLAYLLSRDDFSQQLMTVSAAPGSTPIPLDTGRLESGFPIAFTPEGQIIYVASGDIPAQSDGALVRLNRIAPEAGAQPETLGTFQYRAGCGGGSPIPADWQYWTEAGFGGSGLVLIWTRYGVLHSTNCGGAGLALLNLTTGVDTPIGPDALAAGYDPTQGFLSRAVLSPDGERAAAVRQQYREPVPESTLVLIELATGTITDVPTTGRPDQLAWGPDGTLFYSIFEANATLDNALTPEEQTLVTQVLGYSPNTLPLNRVGIRKVNPADGFDRLLYSTWAYMIGRMALAADGQTLVFSQIPNLHDWGKALAAGTIDLMSDDGSAQRATVPIMLYTTPVQEGEVLLVGSGLDQFRLRP